MRPFSSSSEVVGSSSRTTTTTGVSASMATGSAPSTGRANSSLEIEGWAAKLTANTKGAKARAVAQREADGDRGRAGARSRPLEQRQRSGAREQAHEGEVERASQPAADPVRHLLQQPGAGGQADQQRGEHERDLSRRGSVGHQERGVPGHEIEQRLRHGQREEREELETANERALCMRRALRHATSHGGSVSSPL
jgi:hypothetical protein